MLKKLRSEMAFRLSPHVMLAQVAGTLTVIRRAMLRLVLLVFLGRDLYNRDGLISLHWHRFMEDPRFQRAYRRGIRATGSSEDPYRFQWRVHTALWAAANASRLDGDFVECGVNKGFMSSAIMEYLDWDSLGKTFYLLDTFGGIDPRYVTPGERAAQIMRKNGTLLRTGFYVSSVDGVRANFAQWRNHRIIVGAIPETLEQVNAQAIAFLHIDMNCAPPEIAALRYFWPRLSPGAFVLLDDYAYRGYEEQRIAMDELARELGVAICALPTGQGLIIRPEASPERAAVSESGLEIGSSAQ